MLGESDSMEVGDKLKRIRGNWLGMIGVVKITISIAQNITVNDYGEEIAEYEDYYVCEAEDGTIFFGFQGDL